MTAVTLSSKGQLVLPVEIRQRFGLIAGSRLDLIEEADGIRLVVSSPAPLASVDSGFGMLKAKCRGMPRRLADFDPASLLKPEKSKGKK
jgi:AbrB family looped-hinge helix DNA binding protein